MEICESLSGEVSKLKTEVLLEEEIDRAAHGLREGALVAFPTETVYGLGADATNKQAIEQIFIAKGRPNDNPLIVHVASYLQMTELAKNIPVYVEKLVEHFSPGPLTFILEDKGVCADNVTAGLQTIGLRIPNHPVALKLIEQAKLPIAAPSANVSGKPSPTSAGHVLDDLNGRIPYILDGGKTEIGLESTVIDCTKEVPVILRHGEITKEMLERLVPTVLINEEKTHHPPSPGMKYKHYAPSVPLTLIRGGLRELKEEIQGHPDKRIALLVTAKTAGLLDVEDVYELGETPEEIALSLYDSLRSFKKEDYDLIVCEAPESEGLGIAIMDRLMRAATKIK